MNTRSRALLSSAIFAVAGALALMLPASIAGASSSIVSPIVTVNRPRVALGEQIRLTLDGFKAPFVSISICGNEARRGSSDCDMAASEGVHMSRTDSPTFAFIPVGAPPVPCPCVVRVSSTTNDEVAVVPLDITDHPVEGVIEAANPDDPLLAVSIGTRVMSDGLFGWARSNLGGSVKYEVTVTVKNLKTEPLSRVKLSGWVGRSATDQLATLALDDPGEIGPAQTWQQVVTVRVPAPTLGSFEWRVAASGAGPTVTTPLTTRHRPLLLILFVTVLIADVAYLVMRSRMRRRAALAPVADPAFADPALADRAPVGAGNADADQLVAAAQ